MPTYVYRCVCREETFEKNVPIKERDQQWCDECGMKMGRKIVFTGSTWAPTSTGGGFK